MEPALNNEETALNNEEPALNNGEPALNNEEPALNNEDPALKMKELALLYSFDQEQLKFQLIKISGEIFLDNNTYMKEYSLLKFRLLHPQLPLPDLLFTYTTKTCVDKDLISNFKSVIDFYYDDNNFKTDQYSLTNLLEKSFSFKIPYDFIKASNDLQMFSPPSFPIIYQNENKIDLTSSPELNTSFTIIFVSLLFHRYLATFVPLNLYMRGETLLQGTSMMNYRHF